jgi:monofunctional biosynthetic peptidoglycan transglycosylase
MRWLLRRALLAAAILVVALAGLIGTYRHVNPPLSTLMAWELLMGRRIEVTWAPLEAISPGLVQAVLTSEDNHFCTHGGVDWGAVNEVLESLDDGGAPRGASTITMQVAKNLFLWQSRSYLRKGLELPLAYAIDFAWPKRRVLEVYLNIAQWGPGIFGAEAAARYHFGKSAKELSTREASLLAAALPAPEVRIAGKPGPLTRRNAGRIVRRMRQTRGLFECVETND